MEVKGPKGSLSTPLCSLLKYELADGHVTLTRLEETRESRSQHGLRRTLLANCIDGVTKGFFQGPGSHRRGLSRGRERQHH